MRYDGVVIKIDELYLFLIDPETNEVKDGINISDHECYNDMKENQLMVVNVSIKDGTLEIDNVDLDEFIHGDSYGKLDTFIYIHDIMLYSIKKNGKKEISLGNIDKNELSNIIKNRIEEQKQSNDNE